MMTENLRRVINTLLLPKYPVIRAVSVKYYSIKGYEYYDINYHVHTVPDGMNYHFHTVPDGMNFLKLKFETRLLFTMLGPSPSEHVEIYVFLHKD